jgi:deazaflavin-dependent oxidoreductase (nitroreductase family)
MHPYIVWMIASIAYGRKLPTMQNRTESTSPWLPPRLFIRGAWIAHRAIHRLSGGRRGLAHPRPDGQFGYLRLQTIGRRSGQERAAILGYHEDGPNLFTLAMNGWGRKEPAWWLNLQTSADAVVELKDGPRQVRARAATGEERARLWSLLATGTGYGDLEGFARRRPTETAVVILEPR